jgi:hypothetical protein
VKPEGVDLSLVKLPLAELKDVVLRDEHMDTTEDVVAAEPQESSQPQSQDRDTSSAANKIDAVSSHHESCALEESTGTSSGGGGGTRASSRLRRKPQNNLINLNEDAVWKQVMLIYFVSRY